MKKQNIQKILYNSGMLLLLFVFCNILLSTVLFIFKVSITHFHSIVSFILTIILFGVYSFLKKEKVMYATISIALFILCLFCSLLISSNSYDLTWDGNSYHKTAVGQLKNGWNPVYESIEDFNKGERNNNKIVETHGIWNNHYAKGAWIFSANIYSLTNNIESGKAINFIMVFSVFCIVLSYLLSKFNVLLSVVLALLLALSPVSIAQLFTFYNDGIIYGYIIILITVFLNLIEDKTNSFLNYSLIVIILSSLINIKFTGFFYGGITALFFYIYILLNKKLRKENIIRLTIVGIISLIIGMILIGYSTYVKNHVEHGHLFYPLFGENKVDIMTQNQPKEFENMNRFKKFILANFSETNNIGYFQEDKVTLKIPFTISKKELNYLGFCDLRIGGFGVLFGGILIVSFIVILIGMYFMFFKDKNIFYKILILLTLLGFLIMVLEEAWWARYLPQLYILPLIAIYLLYYFRNKGNNLCSIFLSSIVLLLIVNLGIFIKYNVEPKFNLFENIKNEIGLNLDNELYIYTESFDGVVYNLYDRNLKVNVINNVEKYENSNYKKYLVYNQMLTIYEEIKDKNELSQ